MKYINTISIQERETIKLMLYKTFEKKFTKKYKELDPQEFEHERNQYVYQNFPDALKKYRESKK